MERKVRVVKVKKMEGKKVHKGKLYRYSYNILPLFLYIPKHVVEREGDEFVVERIEDEKGFRIIVRPKERTA